MRPLRRPTTNTSDQDFDVSKGAENYRNIEINVSSKRRLKSHTHNLIYLLAGDSLENSFTVTTIQLDHRTDTKLQYAIIKGNRWFSRIYFAIERETHTAFVNITATEPFRRLMQRLLNSFQIRRPATQRLEYSRSTDSVVQYRPRIKHTVIMNITATEPFRRLVQRLLNSFQIRRPASQRLEYSRSTDVIVL